jgi:hypothetical protein
MIKNVTNLILTLLLLHVAVGFSVAKHHCDMSPVEMAMDSGAKSCCTDFDVRGEHSVPIAGVGVCTLHHHGLNDCTTQDEQDCSCEAGSKYFTPGEVIIVKNPFTIILPQSSILISHFSSIMVARCNSQVTNVLSNFSLPKVYRDTQVEYSVFIC